MANILKLFFRRLLYKGMYAIHYGDKSGSFFIHIKEENVGNTYALLVMPHPTEAIYVKKSEIHYDIKYNNIRFVKIIPNGVYDVCRANFVYYAKKAGIYAR